MTLTIRSEKRLRPSSRSWRREYNSRNNGMMDEWNNGGKYKKIIQYSNIPLFQYSMVIL
jgi:hypothetical protein